MRRFPLLTLCLAAASLVVATIPGAAELLQLNRDALAHGQFWRLLTGHLTHFDADHLRWDVLTLLLLGTVAERDNRRATALALLIASIGISLAVLRLQPQFLTYRGLSGLDSALFGLIVTRHLGEGLRPRHGFSIAISSLAILGFVCKTGYEVLAGDTVFATSTTYAPVPLAHLVGFVIGATITTASVARCKAGERRPYRHVVIP